MKCIAVLLTTVGVTRALYVSVLLSLIAASAVHILLPRLFPGRNERT